MTRGPPAGQSSEVPACSRYPEPRATRRLGGNDTVYTVSTPARDCFDALSEVLAEALEDEGLTVSRSGHGLDALNKLRSGLRPDVILLDLMMPVMDGWAFRDEQSREPSLASIPVVVVTAAFTLPKPIDARAIVRKPFKIVELMRALNELG